MAQVVQHNIMALNSYNKLSTNNSALSKNLEKLSSGYKINRAADDAAGLAISEKMRAQITGLEKATSNAQDGISLVQTAEGALTEVHSMLNRMTELATQSANGTYDETDRANLQKEIDALLDEIDRISDETNFNGIKLLDGSMGAVSSTTNLEEAPETTIDPTAPAEEPAPEIVEAKAATYEIKIDKNFLDGDKLTIGDMEVEFSKNATDGKVTIGTGKDDAAAISATVSNLASFLNKNGTLKDDYTFSADGDTLTITAKNAGADINRNDFRQASVSSNGTKYDVTTTTSTSKGGTAADGDTWTVTYKDADGKTKSCTLTNNTTGNLKLDSDTTIKSALTSASASSDVKAFADLFDITISNSKLAFTAKEANSNVSITSISTNYGGTSATATLSGETKGVDAASITVTETVKGADEVKTGTVDATAAQYTINLKTAMKDGEKFTFGDTTIEASSTYNASGMGNGKFYVSTSVNDSVSDQVKTIAELLNEDVSFSQNYIATCDQENGNIIITAKNEGNDARFAALSQQPAQGTVGTTTYAQTKLISAVDGKEVNEAEKEESTELTNAKYTIKLNGNIAANTKFTYAGVSFESVANTTAVNDDTYQFAVDTSDPKKTAANLASAMAKNEKFKDYNITVDSTTGDITLEKKTAGVDANAEKMNSDPVGINASVAETVKGVGSYDKNVDGAKAEYSINIKTLLQAGDQLKINLGNGETVTLGVSTGANSGTNIKTDTTGVTAEDQAKAILDALEENSTFNELYEGSIDAAGKLTIKAKEVGAATEENKVSIEFTPDTTQTTPSKADAVLFDTVEVGIDKKEVPEPEDFGSITSDIDFGHADVKSAIGNSYNVNGKTYEFVAKGEHAANENAIAVELDDDFTTDDIANALAYSIKTNDSDLEVGISADASNKIIVTKQKASEEDTLEVEIEGKGLGLQIGDTASQRISVNVTDMGTKKLGLGEIDISTEEGATAAIEVIKTAINSVSSTRADLGAIQNRLEHTITNLETTTENLTNAESRIRDTDMAKEMMAYTQNNVLSQAAQAMLAQANQQPQQVLQLLQ